MTLSSQLKGQSRYEIHESEEEPREMLCLLIGTHSGRTYDWLFRKAEKPYHLSICMWAGKEKILAVKFLAWGHQLVTSRDARQEFIFRWLPEELRADANMLLECLVFPWNKSCYPEVGCSCAGGFHTPAASSLCLMNSQGKVGTVGATRTCLSLQKAPGAPLCVCSVAALLSSVWLPFPLLLV